jgi:hypothetical protein
MKESLQQTHGNDREFFIFKGIVAVGNFSTSFRLLLITFSLQQGTPCVDEHDRKIGQFADPL